MELLDIVIYFGAALLGSAINSVAGGGTFITFPVLIINGVGALAANIVSTISLWPGLIASAYAYRKERVVEKKLFLAFLAASIAGGAVGAYILLHTPEQMFTELVPWLLLFATLLFTFGGHGIRWLKLGTNYVSARRFMIGIAFLFVVAMYGGYFGAGIGIMMLAMLQVMGFSDIHRMNALKTVLGASINAAAVTLFVFSGEVLWNIAVVMIAGALCGGYIGARLALKIPPHRVRVIVSAIGFVMTAYFFLEGMQQ